MPGHALRTSQNQEGDDLSVSLRTPKDTSLRTSKILTPKITCSKGSSFASFYIGVMIEMIANMVCSVHSVLRTSKLKYLVHPGAKYSLTTLFSITFDIVDKHSEHHHVEIDVLRVDFGGDVSNLISWYCLKQGYIMLYT